MPELKPLKCSCFYSQRFAKAARHLLNRAKTYECVIVKRTSAGETCLYAKMYPHVVDSNCTAYLESLAMSAAGKVAYAFGLTEFEWKTTVDLSKFADFRNSIKQVELDNCKFEARDLVLVYDVLFGYFSADKYDKDFLDKMYGKPKDGKALALADAVAAEKERLERVKERKFNEVYAWYEREYKKLEALKDEKKRKIRADINAQLNDTRKMLKF